jgi:hypothetical protein
LLIISTLIGEEIFEKTITILSDIMKDKKEGFSLESRDVSFTDFVSQYPKLEEFVPLTALSQDFRVFLQEDETEDKWINTRWIGRALKRLKLSKSQKRLTRGREVILDIKKAQEKIKMFK